MRNFKFAAEGTGEKEVEDVILLLGKSRLIRCLATALPSNWPVRRNAKKGVRYKFSGSLSVYVSLRRSQGKNCIVGKVVRLTLIFLLFYVLSAGLSFCQSIMAQSTVGRLFRSHNSPALKQSSLSFTRSRNYATKGT